MKNNITRNGFTILADAIKYHPSLIQFFYNNRNGTDIDPIDLLDMLKSNTKLRTLYIDQNKNNKTIRGEITILN